MPPRLPAADEPMNGHEKGHHSEPQGPQPGQPEESEAGRDSDIEPGRLDDHPLAGWLLVVRTQPPVLPVHRTRLPGRDLQPRGWSVRRRRKERPGRRLTVAGRGRTYPWPRASRRI